MVQLVERSLDHFHDLLPVILFTLNCPLIILLDVLDSIDIQVYFQAELVQLHLAV